MFKRKSSDASPVSEPPKLASGKAEKKPAAEKQAPAAAAEGAPGRVQARRAGDALASTAARRPEFRQSAVPSAGPAAAGGGDDRKLVVGQGIRLSGEIKKCEKLVVEGEVEANLNDCLSLEIAPNGQFNGAAAVEDAEISGLFVGELTVSGRLLLRSSGQIKGDIRYADLEIERGGRIAGSIDMIDGVAEDDEDEEAVTEAEAEEAPNGAASEQGNGSDEQLDLEAEAAPKPNGADGAVEAAGDSEKPSLPL